MPRIAQLLKVKELQKLIVQNEIKYSRIHLSVIQPGGGVIWVKFCWVCAAGFSEPLPHYSLFCGQL